MDSVHIVLLGPAVLRLRPRPQRPYGRGGNHFRRHAGAHLSQTGPIVVVVIAAGALAFDARRGLSTHLRTRVHSLWQMVAPRFVGNTGAAVLAYARI
jgi:hypothetical protein